MKNVSKDPIYLNIKDRIDKQLQIFEEFVRKHALDPCELNNNINVLRKKGYASFPHRLMKNNRNYFAIDETNCPSKKCCDHGKIPDGSDVEDYF